MATSPDLLGLDTHKLTHNYLGLDQRIVGPAGEARVHHELIA